MAERLGLIRGDNCAIVGIPTDIIALLSPIIPPFFRPLVQERDQYPKGILRYP
jgi:hypothetical protein